MRAKRTSLCCQRIVFSTISVIFIIAVIVVYVLVTLPTQAVFPLSRLSAKDAPFLRADYNTEELLRSRYAVGYYDVRNMYQRFINERKSRKREDSLLEPSEVEDQSYISYIRMINGARDLRDFLVSSVNDATAERDETEQVAMAKDRRWLILAHALRYSRSLESAANRMVIASGVEDRARQTMRQLQKRVWDALERLQSPADCTTIRALRCKLTNPNGLAASIHDVLHCLIRGLQMNRSVILDSTEWHYTKDVEWNQLLKPLSTCEDATDIIEGYPISYEIERVHMTILPDSIADTLMAFHGDPFAWFLGILTSYILRPAEPFDSKLKGHVATLTASDDGYIGLHIRRTDKSQEAHVHLLQSYVAVAEEIFARTALGRNLHEKLVYVATDEPGVVKELKAKFKTYTFLWNEKASQQANKLGTRSRGDALKGVLEDLWALSRSSHLVCTLSSGFCRVAYELMQSVHWDAWRRVSSLDNSFFYAYTLQPERSPVEPVEDALFAFEIPSASREKAHSSQDVVDRILAESLSGDTRDGFERTNDGRSKMARFKTQQPVRVMKYEAEI